MESDVVSKTRRKLRGEHCLNVFVSTEIKERLQRLAERHDRPMSDIARSIIRVGLPIVEGLSEAELVVMRDSMSLLRRLREVKQVKDL